MKKYLTLLLILIGFCTYYSQAQTLKILTPQVFADSLQVQEKPILLDVRTPTEFADGHLKNALNIDVTGAGFKSDVSGLDKTKTYYVYCKSGKRSAAATEQMRTLGVKNIYELEGGLTKWIAEGMQTVKVIGE